jgi:hypothetical protein
MGTPVLVQGLNDHTHVNKMSTGPPLARGPQQPSDFWEFLRMGGVSGCGKESRTVRPRNTTYHG